MTSSLLPPVQWVDDVRRVEGIPGVFRRSGRYLYLLSSQAQSVRADGVPVDGLQVVRTDPRHPTRLEVGDQLFEGYEDGDALGLRWLGRVG